MNFKDTHGGFAGKSLAQKMRDRTDELFAEWMAYEGPDPCPPSTATGPLDRFMRVAEIRDKVCGTEDRGKKGVVTK